MAEGGNGATAAIVLAVAVLGFLGFLAFLAVTNRDRGGTLTMTQTQGGFTIVDRPF